MKYKITKASSGLTTDYTVVYDTLQINPSEVDEIRENAELLLENREVISEIHREISIFVRNRKTVAIITYKYRYSCPSHDEIHDEIHDNFEKVLEQIKQILEVFDDKTSPKE